MARPKHQPEIILEARERLPDSATGERKNREEIEEKAILYQTGVQRRFTARHALVGDFGDETTPHSHSYLVEWIRTSKALDENGFSTDIAAMEGALQQELERIDDKLLNALPFFENRQTSLENVCRFLYERLERNLEKRTGGVAEGDARKSLVRIWENERAWASYDPSLAGHLSSGMPEEQSFAQPGA
ncbi:MAG: 6-pyruvoyl trahydropterin synthase family protein [bacterium]